MKTIYNFITQIKNTVTAVAFLVIACNGLHAQTVTLFKYLGVNVQGITIDASDNVYVSGNNMILKITPAAVTTTLAGSSTAGSADGTGAAASFNNPNGICVDAGGNVYVADKGNLKIRKITPSGVVTTLAGSGTAGTVNATGTAASFQNPTDICLSPAGDLYVTDQMNFSLPYPWTPKVRKISSNQIVTDFCVTNSNCHGLTISNTHLFITQPNSNPGGNSIYSVSIGAPTGTIGLFAGPGLTPPGGSGYVDGSLLNAKFSDPRGIISAASGDLLVADNGNHRIRMISNGTVTTLAGNGGIACVDGPAVTASFWGPNAIAVAGNGDIYIGDYFCQSVRKITGMAFGIKTHDKVSGSFKVYPNPSKDIISLQLIRHEQEFQNGRLTIYNALGQVVADQEYDAIENEIHITDLPTGVYSILLKSGNQCAIEKFIKE